jgi:phosphatidylinositol 3-kinase
MMQALTKFLRSVDWSNKEEAAQAEELLDQWEPIESIFQQFFPHIPVSDALELLSKSFTSHRVRDYAVSRLQQASDAVHSTYLIP